MSPTKTTRFALLGLLMTGSVLLSLHTATRADGLPGLDTSETKVLKPYTAQVSYANVVSVENIEFHYREEAKTRFLALKNDWQSTHAGILAPAKLAELAVQADEKSDVEKTMTQWRFHGGPSPSIFRARAHLYNKAHQAALNLKVQVSVRVKAGQLLVNPQTLLLDFNHLNRSAQWQKVSSETLTVPALAAGEEMLLPVSIFNVPAFAAKHPGQWPTLLEVSVSIPASGTQKTSQLRLIPDHFVIGEPY